MSKEQMDFAWAKFAMVVKHSDVSQKTDVSQKWEAWSKLTWQKRQFTMKQHNLAMRMRAL